MLKPGLPLFIVVRHCLDLSVTRKTNGPLMFVFRRIVLRELCAGLEALGNCLCARLNTEVLLQLYFTDGEKMSGRLAGC